MSPQLMTKMKFSERNYLPILCMITILSFFTTGMECQAPLVCTESADCDDGDSYTHDQCTNGVCSHTANDQSQAEHGFVTLSEDQRYFEFSDGTPFVPIGHVGVYWFGKPYFSESVEEEFTYLQTHGINTVLILLDGNSATQVELRVGEFNPQLVAGMDTLVSAAERHSIYLIIGLYTRLDEALFKAWWDIHPYNKNHDPEKGLVYHSSELLTSSAAIEAAKNRLSFFSEHWGESPNILAWNLWNEFDLVGLWAPNQDDLNYWIRQIGAFSRQRELELYGSYHLRTVSSSNVGVLAEDSEILTSPELDFASFHTGTDDPWDKIGINPYSGIPLFSRIDPVKYITFIAESTSRARQRSGLRPVLDTESITIILNPLFTFWPSTLWFEGYSSDQLDDVFIGSAWAGLMTGAAGPGLRWPCTPYFLPDDPRGYKGFTVGMYGAQQALQRVLSSMDLRQTAPVDADLAVSIEGPQSITPMVLSGPAAELVWLFNSEAAFTRKQVTCMVTFSSLASALYHITWYDLRTGATLQEDLASGPQFTVKSPPFSIFVAATLERG